MGTRCACVIDVCVCVPLSTVLVLELTVREIVKLDKLFVFIIALNIIRAMLFVILLWRDITVVAMVTRMK